MADHMAVLQHGRSRRSSAVHTVTSFEPFTLLSALSQVDGAHRPWSRTGSTTFRRAPITIARRFRLARSSERRAGRGGIFVTDVETPDAALNFGMDETDGARRALRARARILRRRDRPVWNSWGDDAFIRDADSGIFFLSIRPKCTCWRTRAEYLIRCAVPLKHRARPIQGWPVIVQAGASGRRASRLASETAEAVFTAQANIAAGRAFYADVKSRMEKARGARAST